MTAYANSTLVPTDRIALLVDGENMSPAHAEEILTVARRFGDPAIRRVYGKSEQIAGWDQAGFRLVPTRPGKNAADLLLTVEAMTLALKDGLATFVLATSDGDFVYLATQLREMSCTVVGIGTPKAAPAFQSACAQFFKIAVPVVFHPTGQTTVFLAGPKEGLRSPEIPKTKIIPAIRKAIASAKLRGHWCTSTQLEELLRKADPSFDPLLYGHISLESLIEAVGYFDLDHRTEKFLVRYPNPKPKAVATSPLKPHTLP
jgi:hypothetical protein